MICFVIYRIIKIYLDLISSTGRKTSGIYSFITTGHQLIRVTIYVKQMLPVVVLLDGGHDLDVLEGAVCCVVVSVATGNARAVAHGDRGGGQLGQALVLAVHRQLVCKIQPHTL